MSLVSSELSGRFFTTVPLGSTLFPYFEHERKKVGKSFFQENLELSLNIKFPSNITIIFNSDLSDSLKKEKETPNSPFLLVVIKLDTFF